MFQLHDRTRRQLCLAAFVCVGAIPSLLLGGWCVSRHLPGRAQTEADLLGRQLGLTVKLDGVKYLRPGEMLYEGIELADPETGLTIFRSRCLEVASRRETDEQGRRRPTLLVIASQPEIDAARIDLTWRWVRRLLESKPGDGEIDVRFSADGVTLRAGDRMQTVSDVAALLRTRPGNTQAQIDFQLAGAGEKDPASIFIVRDRESSPPSTCIELSTYDNQLPCSLLAIGIHELKPLGERCLFQGRICVDETTDGWDADVVGRLHGLNLDRLVSDHFPHRLSGVGDATIRSARFSRGRLEECDVDLVSKGGHVSHSLLIAAHNYLDLPLGAGPIPDGERLRYQELAMSCSLDANGLRVRGLCKTGEPGTILSDGGNRLLGESSREALPTAALIQTLVPPSTRQLPASRQTDWFLQHLLIRDVRSLLRNETVPPNAHLHPPGELPRK